jgi:hypothetical protein
MIPALTELCKSRCGEIDLEYDPLVAIESDEGPLVLRVTRFGDGSIPSGTWCEQVAHPITVEQADELIAALQMMVTFARSRDLARVQPMLPLAMMERRAA